MGGAFGMPLTLGGGGGGGKPPVCVLSGGAGGKLLRGAGGAGGLLGEGGGGGVPGFTGAGRPRSVFWRGAEGGGTGPRLLGNGAGAAPLGRDFFAASPSNTSRSELALSLIDAALSAFYSDPAWRLVLETPWGSRDADGAAECDGPRSGFRPERARLGNFVS